MKLHNIPRSNVHSKYIISRLIHSFRRRYLSPRIIIIIIVVVVVVVVDDAQSFIKPTTDVCAWWFSIFYEIKKNFRHARDHAFMLHDIKIQHNFNFGIVKSL